MRSSVSGRWVAFFVGAVFSSGALLGGEFKFKTENEDLKGEIGGRVLFNGRFFAESNPRASTFYAKEVFLDSKGTFYKIFDYKVEGNFAGSSATLADGWLGWQVHDKVKLQCGQFKLPVVQEVVNSATVMYFPERPMIERLGPSRDIGLMASGAFLEKDAVSYAVGFSNGNGVNTTDVNDNKDVSARIGVTPFELLGVEEFGKLELAAAGQTGIQTGLGAVADFTSPSTGTTVLDMTTATTYHGSRDRYNPQAFWTMGPASVSAEWCRQNFGVRQTVASTPVDGSVQIDAWYVGGSYFLTGEEKKLGKLPKVKDPWHKDGKGAWELVGRFGGFNASQNMFNNKGAQKHTVDWANKPTSAENMTEIFLGVNFYPIDAVRFSLAYVMNDFKTDIATGINPTDKLGDESAIMTRMQIMF